MSAVLSDSPLLQLGGRRRATDPDGGDRADCFGRARYRALRMGTTLLIVAEGEVADHRAIVAIRPLPSRTDPPRFGLYFSTPRGPAPVQPRSFSISARFEFPSRAPRVAIYDIDGRHSVRIGHIGGQQP